MEQNMAKITNRQWIDDRLNSQGKSMSSLARFMEIDKSAITRLLAGDRQLKTEEAAKIAQFIGSTLPEVLEQTDLAMSMDNQAARIALDAEIDENGSMKVIDGDALPTDTIKRAQAAMRPHGDNFRTALVRARSGPMAILDDSIVLFGEGKPLNGAIGFLAICQMVSGAHIMARIDRARKTGEATVIDVHGKQCDVVLKSAAPILAIIP
jgi:plasmid maintenance system antidote protein VapI